MCGVATIKLEYKKSFRNILFTPSGTKKTYNVLPFELTNTPAFYTTMMQTVRKEWLLL